MSELISNLVFIDSDSVLIRLDSGLNSNTVFTGTGRCWSLMQALSMHRYMHIVESEEKGKTVIVIHRVISFE